MASYRDALIDLLTRRSLQRGEFTLSSGRPSQVYIDARRTTMSAEGLHLIGHCGLGEIRAAGWAPAAVGGMTLGADPVAYAVALASRGEPPVMDAFTIRKKAKGHGTGQRLEGCFDAAAPVVVVEDVITTGGSALEAVEVVRAAGGTVLGVLGIVDRMEGGTAAIEAAGCPVRAVATIRDLGVDPAPPT